MVYTTCYFKYNYYTQKYELTKVIENERPHLIKKSYRKRLITVKLKRKM